MGVSGLSEISPRNIRVAIFRKKFDFEVSVYSRSSCLVALGLALPAVTFAVEFNAEFLNNEGGAPVELKYFENGNSVSPGTYSVDIHLNQIMIRREDVVFSADSETGSVRPVIRVGLLKEIGVDIARLTRDKLIPANLENNTPLNVAELIPGASVEFDVNSLSCWSAFHSCMYSGTRVAMWIPLFGMTVSPRCFPTTRPTSRATPILARTAITATWACAMASTYLAGACATTPP